MKIAPTLLLLASSLPLAQVATAKSVDQKNPRVIFTPADFTQFAPRSALDMVRQVPGFSLREGDDDRGLGQVDTNVLINGQRISGKSNGPLEALGRIPAADVVRLELLDGASLELPGLSGQVLNIVTSRGGGAKGQFRYSPQFRSSGTPFRWGNGEVSISGGGEQMEWTLSLKSDQGRFGDVGEEFVRDGTGKLLDIRQEYLRERLEKPVLSGSLAQTAVNGNILNLTGEVEDFSFRRSEVSSRRGPNRVDRLRVFRETNDRFSYEISADYEFSFAGGRLKIIGLHSNEDGATTGDTRLDFADLRPVQGSIFEQQSSQIETIGRAEFSFSADWQMSVERAQNSLEIEAQLLERNDAGLLESVRLPGASARVEESRIDGSMSYGRPLARRLQLQASIGAEYSRISQTGPLGQERKFIRPKGFAALEWRVRKSLSVSAKLERSVGQLDFFDFIASVEVNDGEINVTNPNLVPPQSWTIEAEASASLGALGSITLRGFAENISDIVDQIPIVGGGQAPGNITSARRYGVATDMTLLSEPIGWRGGRLNLEVDFVDSKLRDPLTGISRRISAQDYFDFEASFRQDFANSDWATGFEVSHRENTPSVRLDQISTFKTKRALAGVFVENKDVFGLTVRASAGNILNRQDNFFKTVFSDRQAGDIAFREERFRNFGMIFTLDVEGSF